MDDELSRLRWRCRRGMRELDSILERFLHEKYASLSLEQRTAFAHLLNHEDDQLWDWLMGRASPEDLQLRQILKVILAINAFDSA